jgi:hypothetical protein
VCCPDVHYSCWRCRESIPCRNFVCIGEDTGLALGLSVLRVLMLLSPPCQHISSISPAYLQHISEASPPPRHGSCRICCPLTPTTVTQDAAASAERLISSAQLHRGSSTHQEGCVWWPYSRTLQPPSRRGSPPAGGCGIGDLSSRESSCVWFGTDCRRPIE